MFMHNVDWHYCLHLALWLFSINEPILLQVCASGTCQSIYYFSREAILHIEISHNLHHIISLRGSNIEITIKMSFVTLDTLWNQTASWDMDWTVARLELYPDSKWTRKVGYQATQFWQLGRFVQSILKLTIFLFSFEAFQTVLIVYIFFFSFVFHKGNSLKM